MAVRMAVRETNIAPTVKQLQIVVLVNANFSWIMTQRPQMNIQTLRYQVDITKHRAKEHKRHPGPAGAHILQRSKKSKQSKTKQNKTHNTPKRNQTNMRTKRMQ